MAKREVLLSPEAVRQFKGLKAAERSQLKDAMRAALAEDDATVGSRNRFRLRRPSEFADYELRVGDLRAFYRVVENEVRITLIGRKKGNQLFVAGKRITL